MNATCRACNKAPSISRNLPNVVPLCEACWATVGEPVAAGVRVVPVFDADCIGVVEYFARSAACPPGSPPDVAFIKTDNGWGRCGEYHEAALPITQLVRLV